MDKHLLFVFSAVMLSAECSFAQERLSVTDSTATILIVKTLAELDTHERTHNNLRLQKDYSSEPKNKLKPKERVLLLLAGQVMTGLVSSIGFAKNGAYWSAGALHVMSPAGLMNGSPSINDETHLLTFGLLNAFALHHYFVKPSSGAPVFWRNFIGLNAILLTSHISDKIITKRKKKRDIYP